MNVHATNGLLAFQGISKIGTPSVDAIAPTPAVDANARPPSGDSSDKVTLSSTAKALAAMDADAAYTPAQARFMATLEGSSDAAVDQIAHDMAHSPSMVAYDISHGDTRLSSTGQVVGDDYVADFNKLADTIDAQQQALYEAEKAKGTDPKEIVAKLFDFRNAQSDVYREATGWGYA
jgi:hypothetical protein